MTHNFASSPSLPVLAFMTDFGAGDGDVGVLKGVALGIVPNAQLIDITHTVQAQNVRSGAWILAASYRYFPKGTVFVCVVDPGVGSARLPIAVHAGDWFFVGPDNGLFSYVYAEQPLHAAVALTNTNYHLPDTSYTFHGRDIFTPVAAHLAAGVALTELGRVLDVKELQRLEIAPPQRTNGQIQAFILHVDHFGNLLTNIPLSSVPDLFTSPHVQLAFIDANVRITARRRFFAEGDEPDSNPFIYGDSSGYVGVAVRNGSAAQLLGVGYSAAITFVISEK